MKNRYVLRYLAILLFLVACTQDETLVRDDLNEVSIEETEMTNPIALEFVNRGIATKQVPPYPFKGEGQDEITFSTENESESDEDVWQTFEEEYGEINFENLFVMDSTSSATFFPLLDNENRLIGILTGFYNQDNKIEYWVKPIESNTILQEGERFYYREAVNEENGNDNQNETTTSVIENSNTAFSFNNFAERCTPEFREFCWITFGVNEESNAEEFLNNTDTSGDITECFEVLTGSVCEGATDHIDDGHGQDGGGSGCEGCGGAGGFTEVDPDEEDNETCPEGQEEYNGNCVPECGENQVRDIVLGVCICAAGAVSDNNGNCVIPEPTPCESALLSRDVYNTSNGERPNSFSNAPLPNPLEGNWELNTTLDLTGITLTDDTIGFNSAVYQKLVNGVYQYMYVTEGTSSFTDLQDWLNNIGQVLGITEQYNQSVANAEILHDRVGNGQLFFTGHSLGGGLASVNALATGRPAYTYNASGLSTSIRNRFNNGHFAPISATIVRGEIIDRLQRAFGLSRAEGIINEIESESNAWIDFINGINGGPMTYQAIKLHQIQSIIDILDCE